MDPSERPQSWTVGALLEWTQRHFADAGALSPRLDAQLLLGHALNLDRVGLYAHYAMPVSEAERERYRELVRRRDRGEPVAYIVGTREFYSLTFEVTPAVLIPRPETELLVDRAREARAGPHPGGELRVIDAGTGSGCLAVTLLRLSTDARAWAVDLSAEALCVARRNAARHGVADRLRLVRADLRRPWQSWLQGERAHVVVANPPYVANEEREALSHEVRDFEPATALFSQGDALAMSRAVIEQAREALEVGGVLLMECAEKRAGEVEALMTRAGYQEIARFRDLQGIERVVEGRWAP